MINKDLTELEDLTELQEKERKRGMFIEFLKKLDLENPKMSNKDIEGRFLILADLFGFRPDQMQFEKTGDLLSILMFKVNKQSTDLNKYVFDMNKKIKNGIMKYINTGKIKN